MAINEIRQQARKSAAERVIRLRLQRADLVKHQEGWSAQVMRSLAERDALIADTEQRAGIALKALVASGLSLTEASRWCDLPTKDATRLIKLATTPSGSAGRQSGTPRCVTPFGHTNSAVRARW